MVLKKKQQRPFVRHVMMPSIVYSRLCNVCSSLSYRVIILVCMTAIFTFLLVEYVHFDVRNSDKYITAAGWQEDVYIFEPDKYHTSPLQDASLAKKCHQYWNITEFRKPKDRSCFSVWSLIWISWGRWTPTSPVSEWYPSLTAHQHQKGHTVPKQV